MGRNKAGVTGKVLDTGQVSEVRWILGKNKGRNVRKRRLGGIWEIQGGGWTQKNLINECKKVHEGGESRRPCLVSATGKKETLSKMRTTRKI